MAQPDFADIYRAYLACRRRKRGTPQAQRYELRLLDHLVESVEALRARRWRPGRSVSFVVRHPKAREIHAAPFRDRVIHHYLVPRLEAIYEPVFIHDVYSNRVGKGTHAAVLRLQTLMRRCQSAAGFPSLAAIQPSESGVQGLTCASDPNRASQALHSSAGRSRGPNGWYLQLDIRSFFNSIDRARLLGLLENRIYRRTGGEQAEWLCCLCRALLATDPAADVRFQGRPGERERVPPHKRLGAAGPDKGLPIGNLSSQFFANVYLNELDQYVKHTLRCRHYVRYVDDFILLGRDPAALLDWKHSIEAFLKERLDLELRPEYRLRPVANGADFLGYIVRSRYLLVRRRVVGHLRDKLRHWERSNLPSPYPLPAGEGVFQNPLPAGEGRVRGLNLAAAPRDALRTCLASYLGHFGHARHVRLVQGLFHEFPWLGQLFLLKDPPPKGEGAKPLRLIPRWQAPASADSLPAQWRYFRRQWPGVPVFLQAGLAIYLFDSDARAFAARFGLRLMAEPPWGFHAALALPRRGQGLWRQRLRQLGLPFIWVAEEGRSRPGLKRRVARHFSLAPSQAAGFLPPIPPSDPKETFR